MHIELYILHIELLGVTYSYIELLGIMFLVLKFSNTSNFDLFTSELRFVWL